MEFIKEEKYNPITALTNYIKLLEKQVKDSRLTKNEKAKIREDIIFQKDRIKKLKYFFLILLILIAILFRVSMYCRSRGLAMETTTTKQYVSDFIYENLDVTTINNYDVIKNHFTNFKIDREYENFLTDQGNHSLSYLKFKLRNTNDEEDWIHLLAITIETDAVIEPTYIYYFREDHYDSFPGSFIDFLNNNKVLENFYINIEMDTIFYLNLGNNIDEDESEDEVEIIPIIEDVFRTEECCICFVNKPNILNYPCLHLSICKECEEEGKFINCCNCRQRVYRKIKI